MALSHMRQRFAGLDFPGIVTMVEASRLVPEVSEVSKQHSRSSKRTLLGKRIEKDASESWNELTLEVKESAFIVYEYCSRLDLFEYVRARFTVGNERLCHALFYQLINSLNFMHQACCLAHLDIKLENVVIDSKYCLKLIDFAYCAPRDAKMLLSKGTERYMAPEVASIFYNKDQWYPETLAKKEPKTYNPEKADIFSLGILLFTMYFGQPPFLQNDI
jgi:serine/threonine protein kinase